MANPSVSHTRRVVVGVGLEGVSGTLVSGGPVLYTDGSDQVNGTAESLEQLAVYEEFNPTQVEGETIQLNRARNYSDAEGFGVGKTVYTFAPQCYVTASGKANVPPLWTRMLRACAFTETRFTASGGSAGSAVITASAAAGGTDLEAGTYEYAYTTVSSSAESKISTTVASDTASAGDEITVASLPSSGEKRVYRTKKTGTGTKYLVAIVPTGVTTFIDRLPDSALAIEAADQVTSATDYTLWTPTSENGESLSIHTFYNWRKAPAAGVRGNLSFDGDAGGLFPLRGNFRGIFSAMLDVDNPSTLAPSAGIPSRACNVAISLKPSGGTEFNPVVKRMGIDLGRTPTDRMDMNAAECLLEVGLPNQHDARWTMTVEVKAIVGGSDTDVDWVGYFTGKTGFQVEAIIGSGTGNRVGWSNRNFDSGSTNYFAQLAEAPRIVDVDGIRCAELTFALTGTGNNHLFIKHY